MEDWNRRNAHRSSRMLQLLAIAIVLTTLATSAHAETFATGSIIVPMDTTYQDSGMFEAYGLVYRLLQNGVTVYWVIEPSKDYGDADFTADAADYPSGDAVTAHSYAGGPFVIDEPDATAATFTLIDAWQATHTTAVHVATDQFTGTVSKTLVAAPSLALFADQNEDVAMDYLNAAGIPDTNGDVWSASSPGVLQPDEVIGPDPDVANDGALFDANGLPNYCQIMTMHWDADQATATAVVAEYRAFLGFPVHLMAECKAVNTIENNVNGRFLTPNGYERGKRPKEWAFFNQGLPFTQMEGPFKSVGGGEPSYSLPDGDVYFDADVVMITRGDTPVGHEDVWMTGFLDGICDIQGGACAATIGKISYLGGHQYGSSLPISSNAGSNGTRLFLNSLFEAECGSALGQANVVVTLTAPASVSTSQITYTITYTNIGASVAHGVTITDTIPAGTTLVSAPGATVVGDLLTWDVGNLGSGAGGSFTFTVSLPGVGSYSNQAFGTFLSGTTSFTHGSSIVVTEFALTETDCTDGVDNDGDGDIDCGDDDCLGDPACPEICTDGVDNDGDTDVDCDDADCVGSPVCAVCPGDPSCPEICTDGVDNDGDSDVDCADAECLGDPSCPEICTDGVDNDGDTDVDCDDAGCLGAPSCPEICTDGLDNDGNGDFDCDDLACLLDPACPEICTDGVDNDGDTDVDCDDTDCLGAASCPEVCTDGLDNDGDGDIDCVDSECEDPSCLEVCADGVDNDADGDVDCEDSDCLGDSSCPEVCDDGIDNDGDGEVDCGDSECLGDDACPEVECDDGFDNDDDALVDCDDSDCVGDPSCPEVCDDTVDNDGDSDTDCDDSDCVGDPSCSEVCTGGVDDDGDGDIDCDDSDCAGSKSCPELECDDGIDNDGDGDVDCDDFDCEGDPACPEICDDGIDNDADGDVDCGDEHCSKSKDCGEVDCSDGMDNDGDGDVDCDDSDCSDDPACPEDCDDGADNNGNGDVDCDDSGCSDSPACGEVQCADDLDNDGDGFVDCEDSECGQSAACPDLTELRLQGGGCSCRLADKRSAGGSPWLLAGILLGGLGLRRRRYWKVAIVWLLLASVSAQAQNVDTLLFKPAPGDDLMTIQRSRVVTPYSLGVFFSVANDPLVEVQADGTRNADIVNNQVVLEPTAAVAFWNRLELGIAVPIVASQSNEGTSSLVGSANGAAVGDIRLTPKVAVANWGGFGIAAALPLTFPTASADTAGDRTVTATPRAIADLELGRVLLAANVGFRARGSDDLPGDLRVAGDLPFGAGVELDLISDVSVLGEIYGATSARDQQSSPVEALGGVRWRGGGLGLLAAAGRGIAHGAGAADFRGVLSLTFAPEETPPPPPEPVVEEDPDPDRDGILGDADNCPLEPEDRDDFEDDDGCPDPDNDQDGILDVADRCPLEPETMNQYQDSDGCPDEIPATPKVVVVKEKIEILEQVFFDTASDVIKQESHAVLNQVATVLETRSDVKLVRIEGHTDDRGKAAYNLDLSQRRAQSVRAYLVTKGVSAGRMEAEGFGESRPLRKGRDKTARAMNRRVDFVIVERTEATQQ